MHETQHSEGTVGEHRENKNAILRAMLPALPPGVDFSNVQLRGGFLLRRGLVITAPEKMRTLESGAVEILAGTGKDGGEEWAQPPEGYEAIAEGTKLGFEHIEFVVHIMGTKVDTKIVDTRGNPHVTMAPLGECLRMPAGEFMRRLGMKEGTVNGEAPSLLVTG